jgi:uncharacterized membrane protein HdeD (DUF308 family)
MNKFKIVRLVESIIIIIIGIVSIIWPTTISKVIAILLGVILLIDGVFNLVTYFLSQNNRTDQAVQLIVSVVFLVMGLVLIIIPSDIINVFIGLIFGFGLLLFSLAIFSKALFKRKLGEPWLFNLIISIALISLSFIVLINSSQVTEWIIRIIGAIIVFVGLSNIVNLYITKKTTNNNIDIDFTKK